MNAHLCNLKVNYMLRIYKQDAAREQNIKFRPLEKLILKREEKSLRLVINTSFPKKVPGINPGMMK